MPWSCLSTVSRNVWKEWSEKSDELCCDNKLTKKTIRFTFVDFSLKKAKISVDHATKRFPSCKATFIAGCMVTPTCSNDQNDYTMKKNVQAQPATQVIYNFKQQFSKKKKRYRQSLTLSAEKIPVTNMRD